MIILIPSDQPGSAQFPACAAWPGLAVSTGTNQND